MQDLIEFMDPQYLGNLVITYIPRIVAAVVVFFAFWLVARVTVPPLRKALRRADFDDALVKLLVDNVYRFAVLTLGVVMAVSQLGIDVAAALAGLGVAGIAVGFAAQDSIANTIAGFLIFWDKPFQVRDFIETQDQYGEVMSITMRTTRIRTPDNTYVVMPNKQIIEDVLINHSMYGETRVRIPVGIAYKEDVRRAREVLLEAAESLEGVVETPSPSVAVTELGDSSVNLELRVWVSDTSLERSVKFRGLEAAKNRLDAAGIEIPFPHLQLFLDDVEDPVWERIEGLPALSRGPTTG